MGTTWRFALYMKASIISYSILGSIGCGQVPNCPSLLLNPHTANKIGTTLTGGTIIIRGNPDFGTLGIIVYDRATGRPMMLTAGHVVYGTSADTEDPGPFPAGQLMYWGSQVDATAIGKIVRGAWAGNSVASKIPDYAVVDITNTSFAIQSGIMGIGDIGGTGMIFDGQPVKMFNNQPVTTTTDSPIGIEYGIVTPSGAQNNILGKSFGASGDSGSIMIEDATNNNQAIALFWAIDPQTGIARITQPIDYVLDTSINPLAVDARLYDPNKNPIALFRYNGITNGAPDLSHYYTTEWLDLLGDAMDGEISGHEYLFDSNRGREGAVYKNQLTFMNVQTMEFHRFYNPAANDMILTADTQEISDLLSNNSWCDGGKTYIPPNNINGYTIQLFRRTNGSQHLYTTDENEANQPGWMEDGGPYWVFAHDGTPDPSVIIGPSDGVVSIDPSCSVASFVVGGQQGETTVSGTVGLTIEPGCSGPTCGLTVANLQLTAPTFSVSNHIIAQTQVMSVGYTLGTWKNNNSYTLPSSAMTVTVNLNFDGTQSTFSLSNISGPLQGALNRDYSDFTLSGDITRSDASIHLSLCGHVVDRTPIAVITPPGPFQCDFSGGAHVTFSSAQSSDLDNDIQHRIWRIDNRTVATDVITLPTVLPLGPHIVGLSVSDGRGATGKISQAANVVDTVPPQLTATVTPDCLFPPNHKYVLYTFNNGINAQATDICDLSPHLKIINVTSNQPSLSDGSGNTVPDFQFGDAAICVRAERDGTLQTPREYTVTIEATDHSGNRAIQQVVISVPHDQSGDKCSIDPTRIVEDTDPRCLQTIASM